MSSCYNKPSIPRTADRISYDNSTSGLTADDVQSALDEVAVSGGASITVNTFNDLPDATANSGKLAVVLTDQGSWLNRFIGTFYSKGWYYSNGTTWAYKGDWTLNDEASEIKFDNADSGLTATDVQEAIDELAASSGGSGGATQVSSGTDITLTVSSTQVQEVTTTTTGLYVILPDATTLTLGSNIFNIYNKGDYNFSIKDGAGIFLCEVSPNRSIQVNLSDNSSVAGTWYIGDVSQASKPTFNLITGTPQVFYSVLFTNDRGYHFFRIEDNVVGLITRTLITTSSTGVGLYVGTVDASGVVTLGDGLDIRNGTDILGKNAAVCFDANNILVGNLNTTTSKVDFTLVTRSGTVLTEGNKVSTTNNYATSYYMKKIDDTRIFAYTGRYGCIITLSGGSISIGTEADFGATNAPTANISVNYIPSMSKYLITGGTSSGQYFTISGNTITPVGTWLTSVGQSNSYLTINSKSEYINYASAVYAYGVYGSASTTTIRFEASEDVARHYRPLGRLTEFKEKYFGLISSNTNQYLCTTDVNNPSSSVGVFMTVLNNRVPIHSLCMITPNASTKQVKIANDSASNGMMDNVIVVNSNMLALTCSRNDINSCPVFLPIFIRG